MAIKPSTLLRFATRQVFDPQNFSRNIYITLCVFGVLSLLLGSLSMHNFSCFHALGSNVQLGFILGSIDGGSILIAGGVLGLLLKERHYLKARSRSFQNYFHFPRPVGLSEATDTEISDSDDDTAPNVTSEVENPKVQSKYYLDNEEALLKLLEGDTQ